MRAFILSIFAMFLAFSFQVANAGFYQFNYCTVIDPSDRVNSAGKELQTIGQIMRQDFVNYCKENTCTSDFTEVENRDELQRLIDEQSLISPVVQHQILHAESIEVCVNIEGPDWGDDDLVVGIDAIFNSKEDWLSRF